MYLVARSVTEFTPNNPYWLGEVDDQKPCEKYSRVATCLALSRAVYARNAEYCLCTLNDLKDMNHGITELVYSQNCLHQYLIAFKKRTKEVYVTFRGTDGWEAIYSDFYLCLIPNAFQGRFHAGFYNRSKLIPLTPFIDLLTKNEDFKLIFTGHSLGGAIAATLTARLLFDEKAINFKARIHCVAFGSPAICDDDCSKYIDRHYKEHFHFYINANDAVPIVLSNFSTFLSDNLPRVTLWLRNIFAQLKGEVQNEEMRFRSSVTDETSSFGENDVSEFESLRSLVAGVTEMISLRYASFGRHFHVISDPASDDSRSERIVPLIESDLQKLHDTLYDSQKRMINWNSLLTRYQNHAISNYRMAIYDYVIDSQRLISNSDPFAEAELIKEFASTSPLHHFFLPRKNLWSAFKREGPKSAYIWSLEREIREEAKEETITLQLMGPAVSLITRLKCEQSESAQNPAKPDETLSQHFLRVFIMELSLRRNPTADDYPFVLITHFETVKLKGLFNPKFFVSHTGLDGRKRQVAELVIMDLYKLAFSYCTFTGEITEVRADESVDAKRRREVKEYLLLCEKVFQKDFEKIKDFLKKNESKLVKQIKEEVSYAHKEQKQREYVLSRTHHSTNTHTEEMSSTATSFELVRLKDVITEWQNKTPSNDESGLATTVIMKKIIPTLVAIVYSTLSPKYDSTVEGGVLLGSVLTFYGMLFFSSLATFPPFAIGVAIGGIVGGVGAYILESSWEVQREYTNILKLLAQSLGVVMEQIVEHPYCLEEKISEIYINTFQAYSDNVDHILSHWTDFFSCAPFGSICNEATRTHYINLIKCINAHFQMRCLLSKDFAVGIIGPGRTGKSKLIQEMFNFNTSSGKKRTVDMWSYRVSDEFRVVDFPHATSTKDPLKSSYLCHHTLVNAVIVVLDARKQGDESGEKEIIRMVKLLANEGVDVLYCFNMADELVKDRPADNVQNRRVNRFKMAENASKTVVKSEQPVTYEFNTCWTKERMSENLAQFAKNYDVDVNECIFTFFELDVPPDQWQSTFNKLKELDIRNPNYIKETWLTKVLESNSVLPESIQKVMDFWYEE